MLANYNNVIYCGYFNTITTCEQIVILRILLYIVAILLYIIIYS